MAIYNQQDIEVNFSGDIQIGANGDLKLADSFTSQKNAVNWFLRTNKGDYQPDARLGCDVGTFIGDSMTDENLRQLEDVAQSNLIRFVLSRSDVNVNALPLSCEEVGIFVSVGGKYLDSDGNLLTSGVEVVKYVFPYLEGEPQPIP